MTTLFLQAEGSAWQMPVLMIAVFAIFWFFMVRPQQKRQKEVERRRNELTKGDSVVTAGGIHGKIKEVNDTTFVIEIADGVRIQIEKASVFALTEDNKK